MKTQTTQTLLAAAVTALLAACGGGAASTTAPKTEHARREMSASDRLAAREADEIEDTEEALDDAEAIPPDHLTDAQIMVYVLAELMESPEVVGYQGDVDVQDGVATLQGSVDNLLSKRAAIDLAKNVRGVRSVIDRLTVAPTDMTDRQIQREAENVLLFDPTVDARQMAIVVEHGIATVTGTVDSAAKRQVVDDIVASVEGVRGVDLELQLAPQPVHRDGELLADLETAYATSADIDGALMNVDVDGSEVVLSGYIGSAAEREHARKIAYMAGATAVDDEGLEVEWWRRREMAPDVTEPGNDWIRTGIQTAMRIDPRIADSDDVNILVDRGVVTLTGSLDNLMAVRAARRIAEDTRGVRRVYSYVLVRPRHELTDETLAHRVETRLAADPYADAYDMTVDVHHGVLTLMGDVHSNFEREEAESSAASVDGLLAIDNRLEIREPVRHETDVEVSHDVASKLERDAWVSAGNVMVSSVGGLVSLRGDVSSPYARRRAIDDAYEAGADRVDAHALAVR